MSYNPFENAEAIRDKVTKEQAKHIAQLYREWGNELEKRANWLGEHSGSWSSTVQQRQYLELRNQMQQIGRQISNDVYTEVKGGMSKVSDAVIADSVGWLHEFGFDFKGLDSAFEYVPSSVVNSLVNGSVYGGAGSWNLSKAIWTDNEKMLRDVYEIMGKGLATNDSIEQITRNLSLYVNPDKAFDWQGPNGLKIYKHKVDYNAQRLARTLTQHTYQQSMVAAAKNNPFIQKFVWYASGSRACPICAERDGAVYDKDKVPLDHPNGMCTMEPVIDDDIVDRLADWVNSEDGTYPEIDEFGKKFGYEPGKTPSPVGVKGSFTKASASNSVTKAVAKSKANIAKHETESSFDTKINTFRDGMKKVKKQKRCGLTDDVIDEISDILKQTGKEGLVCAYNNVLEHTRGFKFIRDNDGGSYWLQRGKKLSLDVKEILKEAASYGVKGNSRYQTFFHELGHVVDRNCTSYFRSQGTLKGSGAVSATKQMRKALSKDIARIASGGVDRYIREAGLSPQLFGGADMKLASGASDFLSGIYHTMSTSSESAACAASTINEMQIRIKFGHSESYYTRAIDDPYADVAAELFANCCAAIGSGGKEYEYMKAIAPNFLKAVEAVLG